MSYTRKNTYENLDMVEDDSREPTQDQIKRKASKKLREIQREI